MTTIAVWSLVGDDWRRYRAVRLAALADTPEAFSSTLARERAFTEAQWRERLEQGDRCALVAEHGGEARGLIGVLPAGPGTAELVSMWVSPAGRGRGISDLLVRAALRWAEEHDRPEMRLWVAEGNDAAERLYTRHGFRRTGAVQPIRAGEPRQEFAMTRPAPVPDVTV